MSRSKSLIHIFHSIRYETEEVEARVKTLGYRPLFATYVKSRAPGGVIVAVGQYKARWPISVHESTDGMVLVLRATTQKYGLPPDIKVRLPKITEDTKWVIHKSSRTPSTETWTQGFPWQDQEVQGVLWKGAGVTPQLTYTTGELPLAWAHADAGSYVNLVGYTVSPEQTPEWEAYNKTI